MESVAQVMVVPMAVAVALAVGEETAQSPQEVKEMLLVAAVGLAMADGIRHWAA